MNIKDLMPILTISTALLAGLIFAEDRYAKKQEEQELKKDTAQLLLDMRIDFAEQRKSDLLLQKKSAKDPKDYQLRIEQIDKEIDRLYQRKSLY